MSKTILAESIRFELLQEGKKRILIKNMHHVEGFAALLSSALEGVRVLEIDCKDDNSLRDSIMNLFTGDGYSCRKTAFEAGWRSHVIEISIYSEAPGLEVAAGLHAVKAEVESFVMNEIPLNESTLVKLYASFAWSLPTAICFINGTGRPGCPALALWNNTTLSMPALIICRNESGDFLGADSILEAGMMSSDLIQQYLWEQDVSAVLKDVEMATGGDKGLVMLYVGLHRLAGKGNRDVFLMLDSFLQNSPDLVRFAQVAAVLGMQFLPGEIFLLSEVMDKSIFLLGHSINLWQGHLVGCFSSSSIRNYFISGIQPEERNNILQKATGVVLGFRGENTTSYQVIGDLQVRSGNNSAASEAYERSADLAAGHGSRADLYRRAALFSDTRADDLLFQAALSFFRGDFYPEAVDVLRSMKNLSSARVCLLWELCELPLDESLCEMVEVSGENSVPELVPGILESRELHRTGYYHRAERILLNHATEDRVSSVVSLVELGEQLYRRGMVEMSVNTMKVARREAVSHGTDWLERKALFTLLKAWSRLGKQEKLDAELGRLIELTQLSGNKRKLVSLYNLYANSQLRRQRYDVALNIYSLLLRTLVGIPDSVTVRIAVLNNMGVAQRKLYHTNESLHTLMRQVRLSVRFGNLSQACIAYGNMARIFIHLGKTDVAEDCLESMIEFASMGKISEASEPICYISSQLAFMRGDMDTAFSFLDQSIMFSIESGKKRRLSLGLVTKGSMLLRLNRYKQAVDVLTEAMDLSLSVGSELNAYVSEMKLTAAKCFIHQCQAVDLLAVEYRGNPDDTQKGEQMFYHWLLTGSRQSLTAAAQLISRGLAKGLHYHSYLYMLQKIKQSLPASLADAIPLVHNYPSCD